MPLPISDGQFSRYSGDVRAVASAVVTKVEALVPDLMNALDAVCAKAHAAGINAEQNWSLFKQDYHSLTDEFFNLDYGVAKLESSFDHSLEELRKAQWLNHQLHWQSVEKDRFIERLKREFWELHNLKEQLIELNGLKDLEISEKNATIKGYIDKIVALIENAAQKEARLREVEAELGRSQAAYTRPQQEKEILERQNTWLNDELTAKVKSCLDLRRKQTELDSELSSKLADVERQFSECSKSLQWNKDRVRELEMKLKSIQEELISAKDAAAANEERFSAELSNVNELNELYKKSSEEWSRKAAELDGVVKVMEPYLKQVEDDYKEKLEKEVSTRKQAEKEAAKKSLEEAAERVRCLEDDLTRSRNEITMLQSEYEKMAFEARGRLDSLTKEFEHQKVEANRIFARNEELSRVIGVYQQKLHENFEHLNAAEAHFHDLSKELSVLKNEKEVISNAEKIARAEVCSLSECVHCLQQERENLWRLALDRDQTLKNSMRQVEDMRKELANAYDAVASADSRAAAAAGVCPICLTNERDLAFGCGHMTCRDCGFKVSITNCPICRERINIRVRLYNG